MRISVCSVMLAFALSLVATSTFAQDQTVDPEAGDVGTATTPSVEAEASGDAGGGGIGAGGPAKPISAALLLGYGIGFDEVNYWGFGFGVRGGYNLGAIYLGARFSYFFGEDPVNLWELGVEGGYDLAVAEKITVRPQLGLGIATLSVSVPDVTVGGVTVGGGSASSSEFYLAPGVTGLYDVNENIFVGLEARFQFVLGDGTATALTLLATAGMRF